MHWSFSLANTYSDDDLFNYGQTLFTHHVHFNSAPFAVFGGSEAHWWVHFTRWEGWHRQNGALLKLQPKTET